MLNISYQILLKKTFMHLEFRIWGTEMNLGPVTKSTSCI